MTKQEIFEYLRDNLKIEISIDVNQQYDYGSTSHQFEVKTSLLLNNPGTDEYETIDTCTSKCSLYSGD